MEDKEREMMLANIAELQAIVEENDESGWSDVHEEIQFVQALLCEKESFYKAACEDSDQSELLELRRRLKELQAEGEEADEQGRAWAESVEIVVGPIDPSVVDRTASHLRSLGRIREVRHADIVNYFRHNYTNYESLLREGEEVAGAWYEILRPRIDALVEQRLEVLGID
jgi:hypothetical protein